MINWHITEACNFRCHYCYAKWQERPRSKELFLCADKTSDFLRSLFQFFDSKNQLNPLRRQIQWRSVRLNIAGGEPTLLNGRLPRIVEQAKRIGFKVSMISNGFRLNYELVEALSSNLSNIGLSLDSTDSMINQRIGRMNSKGRMVELTHLLAHIRHARSINPELEIKLNTVVNRHNLTQNLSPFVKALQPERWKILRVLPVLDDSLAITETEFLTFVERHDEFKAIQSVESNEQMVETYLMLDPYGRFFQNSPVKEGSGYVYSQPVLTEGVAKAFAQVSFDPSGFKKRYSRPYFEEHS